MLTVKTGGDGAREIANIIQLFRVNYFDQGIAALDEATEYFIGKKQQLEDAMLNYVVKNIHKF